MMDDSPLTKPLICLDGANIAHCYAGAVDLAAHAASRAPDARGVALAARHFHLAGHDTAVVLPLAFQRISGFDPTALAAACPASATLVWAPLGDDLFLLALAQEHNAFVLSNDRFRAEVALTGRKLGALCAQRLAAFLSERAITFAFSQGGGALVCEPIAASTAAASERSPLEAKIAQYPTPATPAPAVASSFPAASAPAPVHSLSVPPVLVSLEASFAGKATALIVLRRFGGEIVGAVESALRGPVTAPSSAPSSGGLSLSIPVASEAELCVAIARLAANEAESLTAFGRQTGKGGAPNQPPRDFVLWSAERKAVLNDGVAQLARRGLTELS